MQIHVEVILEVPEQKTSEEAPKTMCIKEPCILGFENASEPLVLPIILIGMMLR